MNNMNYRYAAQNYNKEHMARAVGRDIGISFKQSIEISNKIRGMPLARAKKLLTQVTEKKAAIPYRRFTDGVGHRPGHMGAGRYPLKASSEIIRLLESAEANAQFKGLNTADLVIRHICVHKGTTQWHYGRQRRRRMKRINLEIMLAEEKQPEKELKKEKKSDKKKGEKS